MRNFFKKILCPIDFDENSIAALEAARDLAVDPDATIYVLHVITLVLGGFPKQFHAYPLTITLASQHNSFIGVWIGSTVGMVVADGLAIIVGRIAGARLPESLIKFGAATIFVVTGLFTLIKAVSTRFA